jgi:outer membrane protein OmpA-like peptidoglycan-associated protein
LNTTYTNTRYITRIAAVLLLLAISLGSFAQDCPKVKNKKAQKKYDQALELLRYRKLSDATLLLNEVVADEPEFIKAWWVLGDINSRQTNRFRHPQAAIDAYTEVILICPSYKDYYAYFYLANLYFETEQYAAAKKTYDAFIAAESDRIKPEHKTQAKYYSRHSAFYEGIFKNKVPFNPQVVKGVSTLSKDEFQPLISPDNEYIYFTRVVSEHGGVATSGGVHRSSRKVERFCFAQRINGQFGKGDLLPYPFNQTNNEGSATLTINNKEMFFVKCETLPNRYYNCDIYTSKFENGEWSDIKPLGRAINTDQSWESQPSISSDGKTLYFVSNRPHPKAVGGVDIYISRRGADGKWSPATPLPEPVNTEGDEKTPFIHTDSQTLYFSSSDREDPVTYELFHGHLGLGGYDIFFTRKEKGVWTQPKNIGYPINSKRNDLGFTVSTDGRLGYFASNKFSSDSTYNILSFELYEEARPQKVLFIKGTVKDEKTQEVPKETSIEVKNLETKEITQIEVDASGDYAAALVFDADFVMTAKKQDYSYVSRYISQIDQKFQQPSEMNFEIKPIEVGETYKIEDIFFDTDSDVLRPISKIVIESFYEFLIENPSIHIEIQGHTDDVGSNQYNMELSNRRAQSVYNELLRLGIDASRMTFKGYGETKPVASNQTEAGRQQNRRTVFQITKR